MKDKPDFTIFPTKAGKGEYCNKIIEVGLSYYYPGSYSILETIYYLGRWYAKKSDIKKLHDIKSDEELKRQLDPLEKLCLIKYKQKHTHHSYIKLTSVGASLVKKKKSYWKNKKTNDTAMLEKSDIIFTLAFLENSDLLFLGKYDDRDENLSCIFKPINTMDVISIDNLEQNHIYIVNCNTKEITFGIKYSTLDIYIKDCTKIYEFVSKYIDVNDININIVLLTKDKEETKLQLLDVKDDDFKKTTRIKLVKYFLDRTIGISFEEFLPRIYNSTTIVGI